MARRLRWWSLTNTIEGPDELTEDELDKWIESFSVH